MRPLIKVMLILAALFASTFILGRVFGLLTEANIRAWLEAIGDASPLWIAGAVFLLLFIDLFVAVPTLTITILAGFFLGFPAAFATAFAGVGAAALVGYALSWRYGRIVVAKLVKDPVERQSLEETFQRHGPGMILLSRAAPIVPEVTACMAGATRMPLGRFLLFFLIGTLPYVGVATYAGSVSTLDDPRPAIFAAIGLYAVLWTGWLLFRRRTRRQTRRQNLTAE